MRENAEATVSELTASFPEDAFSEQIQYAVYLREKVEKARKAVANGEIVSEREIEILFRKWQHGDSGDCSPEAQTPEINGGTDDR